MYNTEALKEFGNGVYAALETYSNVHRGSGHNSMVTTHLFDQARDIVLEYLALDKSKYVVIFCTPLREEVLRKHLKPGSFQSLSSLEIGLSLGVRALAAEKKALPGGSPFHTGGGTARLVSKGWVIWAGIPERFEAGTPAIINIIAFAKALRLIRQFGKEVFLELAAERKTAFEILYHDELDKYSGRELLIELRQMLIGRNITVPTADGTRPYINLDNSASTPAFMPVYKAVLQTWEQPLQIQQEIIKEVRSICSIALGAPLVDYDIIFTSNTTESINLAAGSFSRESDNDTESVLLSTLLEHSSNDLPWRMVQNSPLIRLPIDNEGFIDLKEMEAILSAYNLKGLYGKKRITLVSVSGASNVLGVYNDIAEISRIVHLYGARLLVDAAQMVAHRKVDMQGCGIDLLAFSAHKVYAPFGCGVLVAKKGLLNFNSAELGLIQLSGEENAGGIAALGKALLLLQRVGMDLIFQEEQALTRKVLLGMSQIPGLRIYGIKDPDSPVFSQKGGVILFGLNGIMANRVAKELAERGGIGVRYGCHCAHSLIKHLLGVGPFLERFQGLIVTLFPKISLPGLARVSLGIGNSEEDIDALIKVLGKIAAGQKVKADIKKQLDDFTRAAALRVYNQVN